MTAINRVLYNYPEPSVPDDIYLVKRETGVELGMATKNLLTPTIVELKKPMTLNGPTSLYYGELGTYQITNYGTQQNYVVASTDGTVTPVNDTITFICNDTNKTTASFSITESFESPFGPVERLVRVITIEMKVIAPSPPEIVSPVNGSTVDSSGLTLTTSDFDINYQAVEDVHLSTDWEIATDPDFTNIVASSYNDTVNLTTFTP